ncbi:hypothetical protein [Yeosuana marina]|uniref:hypothetical protein n=1 Tax=Yeosuana marina TaxID=1565536 RepID=UPI0030C7EB5D
MTSILKPMLFIFLITISIVSCNNEELFVEPTADAPVETTTPTDSTSTDTTTPPEDTTVDPVNTTTPCDFDLSTASSGDTIIIDCLMDLHGQTVTLPSNVTILYEGGDITNGTLNFSDNSVISGELLNSSLTLSGSTPQLKDTTFQFDPQRWGIVEGKVSDDVALNNKIILQNLIDQSKSMGADTFSIDKMDAFFHFNYWWHDSKGYMLEAIHLPSNFHFKMSNETFIRLQPNNWPKGLLFGIYEENNVTISGGNLLGDRYSHDYSPIADEVGIWRNSHEWPTVLGVAGCTNVVIDGVKISDATGDGFVFGATKGFTGEPNKKINNNVVLENCIITSSRRNNITVGDGEHLKILNNTILKAGDGETKYNSDGSVLFDSAGVNPKYGLDVEPWVIDDVKYEWVENVLIQGNEFRENEAGSIIIYAGNYITVDSNYSDHSIAQNETLGSKITNNVIEGNGKWGRAGITSSDFRRYTDKASGLITQYAVGNDILNNKVSGFSKGLFIRGGQAIVSNNEVSDVDICLQVDRAENIEIYNNVYNTNKANSTGIILSAYANNVSIHDEKMSVSARCLFINELNRDKKFSPSIEEFTSSIANCNFKGGKTSRIYNASGLIFNNNYINTSNEIILSNRIDFKNNTVEVNYNGVLLDNSTNSKIIDNNFLIPSNYESVVVTNESYNANNIINN